MKGLSPEVSYLVQPGNQWEKNRNFLFDNSQDLPYKYAKILTLD
jgi:hypothetical protein